MRKLTAFSNSLTTLSIFHSINREGGVSGWRGGREGGGRGRAGGGGGGGWVAVGWEGAFFSEMDTLYPYRM